MQQKNLLVNPVTAFIFVTFAVSAPMSAHADTIGWANWSGATAGTPGTATGTIGSITVTYSGENNGLLMNYPSWTPTATFTGGVVSNAPPAANNSVKPRADHLSPRRSRSPPLSSILSSQSGAWALPALLLSSTSTHPNTSPSRVVVVQRSMVAQPLRSSVRAYKAGKATVSSSSTAPTAPSPSLHPTSRTTMPSPSAKTPRSPTRLRQFPNPQPFRFLPRPCRAAVRPKIAFTPPLVILAGAN